MIRDALLAAGCQLFAPMLQQRIDQIGRAYQPGPRHRFMGRRPLVVTSLFGDVSILRDYYIVADGGAIVRLTPPSAWRAAPPPHWRD